MPESNKPVAELSGWKQIASYAGMSVRKAQTMEKSYGLPVHRPFGPNGQVVALAAELDGWKAALLVRPDSRGAEGPQESTPASAPEAGPTRRSWLRYGLLAAPVAAAGLGIGFMKSAASYNRRPTGYRVSGATLTVFAEDGLPLWRHTFQNQMLAADYGPSIGSTGLLPCQFLDVNGDGHFETLFHYLAPTISGGTSKLVCFDRNGALKWQFVPGRLVTDNLGRQWPPPYKVVGFSAIPRRDTRGLDIVVSSVHYWSFPTQVAVLDGRSGQVQGEYWHRGHLKALTVADLDGDGKPQILLGGVNDAPEHKQATVVIFDPQRIAGADRDPDGRSYYNGMAAGTEKRILFLPKTPVSLGHEFNLVSQVRASAGHLVITVVEDVDQDAPNYVLYDLDYALRPQVVLFSDQLQRSLRDGQAKGIFPQESLDQMSLRLKQKVIVI